MPNKPRKDDKDFGLVHVTGGGDQNKFESIVEKKYTQGKESHSSQG